VYWQLWILGESSATRKLPVLETYGTSTFTY
jgi:hypothetical protein